MALIVEDGTGLADAEAYASVAFADDYVAKFSVNAAGTAPATWTGASETQKENALRIGAQYLETTFGPRFKGQPLVATQALHFPATGVTLPSGITMASDIVPPGMARANVEAALEFIAGSDLFVGEVDQSVAGGTLTAETVKVDAITIQQSFSEGSTSVVTKKTFGKIAALVAPLIRSGWSFER